MNAVEIEAAVSELFDVAFDPIEFPYAFLAAFGNKNTTLDLLRKGGTNKSDVPGGVLQRNNIHLAVAPSGQVSATLDVLRASPETAKGKVKFILATDGDVLEAEGIATDDQLACEYADFPNHFGTFLPLAGISIIKEIKDSAIDIKATGRLNKLYLELLKENPGWATEARRPEMNHFMARLIFCFFAEDTGIFEGTSLFTSTVDRMSEASSSNTHEIIRAIFHAMNVPSDKEARGKAKVPNWVDVFPYVNGGLFSGSAEVPKFTRIARTYLLRAGRLNWHEINPDIFGSMIQAIADDEERSALGMHYTSVPNILKVLNPLFLDDLRARLDAAGGNARLLLNLKKRMAKIRVFDPACGSGNFLVIAYKKMREIEAEINKRRKEEGEKSVIPLTNFRGIELRHFPAEIARLALIIAEYQCDELYRGQREAIKDFLPLSKENWITCGNALELDWLALCPPTDTGVKLVSDDLFQAPLEQPEIDFVNEGGETYIASNPPYLGSTWQTAKQKAELAAIFNGRATGYKSLDYVSGWFMKAADYGMQTNTVAAFVSTNSICQGQQVPILWPLIFRTGHAIVFAHTSFKWANLASHNAGVTVVIVGISNHAGAVRRLYSTGNDGVIAIKEVAHINAYLASGSDVIVDKRNHPDEQLTKMDAGGKPVEGGHLLFSAVIRRNLIEQRIARRNFIKRVYGASEYIRGDIRYCLWVSDSMESEARADSEIVCRLDNVAAFRKRSPKLATVRGAEWPHRFEEIKQTGNEVVTIIPKVSSETRQYLPVGLLPPGSIVTDLAFALYDAPLWNMALIASRLHLVWIATVCGKLKTDFRYSNTLGWNTFPVPPLTEQNKADLTRCAEDILLARESHFPATIADLYDPDNMPENLRRAHERNDEVLERIYIGRRFKNDTERLEKLFGLYSKMTAASAAMAVRKTTSRARKMAQ